MPFLCPSIFALQKKIGLPIILLESEKLSGRKSEYLLIDDTELRLTIFAAHLPYLPLSGI
jgi:hypothetical protein